MKQALSSVGMVPARAHSLAEDVRQTSPSFLLCLGQMVAPHSRRLQGNLH